VNNIAATTHPDIAALFDPLFGFAVKRVQKVLPFLDFSSFVFAPLSKKSPLSAAGEGRVVQRSADRVSLIVD
jgi:hypothetical protein